MPMDRAFNFLTVDERKFIETGLLPVDKNNDGEKNA
jgi:hypothetical protein